MVRLAWNISWNALPWLAMFFAAVYFIANQAVTDRLEQPHWVTDEVLYLDATPSIDAQSIVFTRTVNVSVVTADFIVELHRADTGLQVAGCPAFEKTGTFTPDEPKTQRWSIRQFFGGACLPPPGEYYLTMTADYRRNGETVTEQYRSNNRFVYMGHELSE